MNATSTAYFISQPGIDFVIHDTSSEYDSDSEHEINQQAIDQFSDNKSEGSENSDALQESTLSQVVESDFESDPEKTLGKQSIFSLANDIDFLVSTHQTSKKRSQEIDKLGKTRRKDVPYTYFHSDEDEEVDEDDIPSQSHVTDEKNSGPSIDDILNSKLFSKSQRPIPEISYERFKQLNGIQKTQLPKEEKLKMIPKIKPRDFDRFNEIRHPSSKSKKPTSMSGTQLKPVERYELTNKTEEKPPPNLQIYKTKVTPKDPTQERIEPVYWDSRPVPNNPPSFYNRGPVEFDKSKYQTSKPLYKERKIKHIPVPEPEPIVHTGKNKIGNFAPTCVKHPEKYDRIMRKRIKEEEERKKKIKQLEAQGQTVDYINDEENLEETDKSSQKNVVSLPPDKSIRKKHLQNMLSEADTDEWELPKSRNYEPSVSSEATDFLNDDTDDFLIGEEYLTDTEKPMEDPKIRPVHYDPHETHAVKVRNQYIRQKLALKKAKQHLEEEDDDDREMKRRKVSREITPALKRLEMMSNFHKADIEEKRKQKAEDNKNRAIEPLCAAIRSAENTKFMLRRDIPTYEKQSERNAKRKKKIEKQKHDEEEKRMIRAKKKERMMELWKP